MPTVDPPAARSIASLQQALIDRLVDKFGPGARNEANPVRLLADAGFSLPFDALENEALQILLEFDPNGATTIANLLAGLYPLFEQVQAAQAAGKVQVSYKAPLPTTPTPLFSSGEVDFIDAAGRRHRLSAAIDPPLPLFDSNESGTASPTLDASTNTRLAQRFPSSESEEDFVQAVRFTPAIVSGTPTVRVRIETDSAGSPSGVLADARLEKAGVALADGVVNEVVFTMGALLDEDEDYWVVLDSVAGGTFTVDGGAGGASNQVKVYTSGSWTLTGVSTENLNIEVVHGGVASVRAVQFGPDGNAVAGSVSLVAFANSTAQTVWGNVVSSFENLRAFEGGRDAESLNELKRRVRSEKAARETGSLDSIVQFLRNGNVAGVTGADGIENETDDWGTEDTVLNNLAMTGTSSETVDGTTTMVAQRFTTTEDLSVTQVALDFDSASSFGFSVRIETDAAGSPSGTLASPKLERTGLSTSTTGRQAFDLGSDGYRRGDFLPAGTYWLVVTRTAGSAAFEGSSAGATDNVKVNAGSWALDANIEDARWEVYGGLPPHSFRVYADGTYSNDDMAQAIHDHKPAGAWADGPLSGNAVSSASGATLVRRFSATVAVPIVVKVIVTKDPLVFNGDVSTIRDLVIEYVGGTDSGGVPHTGVGVSKAVDYDELRARLIHGDVRTDGLKVTTLYIGTKAGFPTPASLTSSEVVDLPLAQGRRYVVDVPASDIAVTIN